MEIKFDNINEFKAALEAGKITKPRFVSIRNYQNKNDEVSNYLINLGINYKDLQREDLALLSFLSSEDFNFPTIAQPFANDAYNELIESLIKNIDKDIENHTTMSKAQLDTYTTIAPNVKIHNETEEIYITGYIIRKTIITPGNYKARNKRPKTIAKDTIRKVFKASQYRQFILKKIGTIRLNGLELIIE
jgi:hypothetical protein